MRLQSVRARFLSGGRWRIQAEDRLSFFHNPDPVAGYDFDIFAVGFEKVHLPLTARFGELFVSKNAFLLGELVGERTVAKDFGIKSSYSHGGESNNDEGNHHPVGFVPNLGVLAAF